MNVVLPKRICRKSMGGERTFDEEPRSGKDDSRQKHTRVLEIDEQHSFDSRVGNVRPLGLNRKHEKTKMAI